MARRAGVEERIAAAEALRHAEPSPELTKRLRAGLADRSSLVVAATARAAREHRLPGLEPELLAALDRAYDDPPEEADPQCHAKLALLEALDALGHDDGEPFLRAARHIQLEPVWGGVQDSAPRVRMWAVNALARIGHLDLFRVVADLLADPSHEVRGAAARLAGELGGERAVLLLRLRLRVPDEEPENLGDYAAGLLAADGQRALPLITPLLDDRDPARAAGAALALGGSRLAEALAPLVGVLDRPLLDDEVRRAVVTAIALLRSEASAEALLHLLAEGRPEEARTAAENFHLYRDRSALVARAQESVRRNRKLAEVLAKALAG